MFIGLIHALIRLILITTAFALEPFGTSLIAACYVITI
jgi:hypothetical protein